MLALALGEVRLGFQQPLGAREGVGREEWEGTWISWLLLWSNSVSCATCRHGMVQGWHVVW